MKSPRTAHCVWLSLLFAGLFLQAPLAAGPVPPFPPQSHLAPEVRSRLAEAARDSKLEPWQRDFMLGVARGTAEEGSTEPALPGLALPPTGIAANDGVWAAVTAPSGRYGHAAIYDPLRDRMVVFGGYDGSISLNDVWTLSLAGNPAWSALAPTGTPPSARVDQSAIYDPVRDRLVVFGGFDGSYRNDVWALSLADSAWSALAPSGTQPAARIWHTAIYDPVRDRMVVFGGYDGSSRRNDVWALSLSGSAVWSVLAPTGTPPSARYSPSAIYDPVRDRMVMFGGNDGSRRNDLWALSLAGSPVWSVIDTAGSPPAARYQHTAVYDSVRDRMVVFGGYDGSYRNDVWALSFADSVAWKALSPAGSPPPGRAGHTAIYDPVRDRLVVFGGNGGSSLRNDTWALSLAGPAWSALTPVVPLPSPRYFHTAFYDPVRDRMVVFGGFDGSTLHYRNDVWALSLSGSAVWSVLAPTGTPPSARIWHAAIYDPVRDRMVVFGGYDGSSLRNDVWALSLAGNPAWSELATTGTPPAARYQHTVVYDSPRDRMVVFGGYDGGNPRNDVWVLSLAGSPAWSALAPAGSPPAARFQHTAIYDPARDRMVVFGGNDDSSLRNDVWALSLAGSTAWSALASAGSPPTGRSDFTAIYDPVRDRMVVFGGYGGSPRNEVWALVWGTPGSVPGNADAPTSRFEFAPPRPNPSRGETFVDFELGEPARVVLDVFDAHGRRVKRIADGWFPAGRNVTTWRGDDDRGHALVSGMYFIRMQGGGFQATRRTVRIR